MPLRARRPCLVLLVTALALTGCAGEPADSAGPSAAASTTPPGAASPDPTATVPPSPSGVALGSRSAPPTGAPTAAAAQNAFEISFAEDQASGDTGRLVVGLGDGPSPLRWTQV